LTPKSRLSQDAPAGEEWLTSDTDGWPFDFVRICDSLDPDADYLRAGRRRASGLQQVFERHSARAQRAFGRRPDLVGERGDRFERELF
jgi:antirestriction protein